MILLEFYLKWSHFIFIGVCIYCLLLSSFSPTVYFRCVELPELACMAESDSHFDQVLCILSELVKNLAILLVMLASKHFAPKMMHSNTSDRHYPSSHWILAWEKIKAIIYIFLENYKVFFRNGFLIDISSTCLVVTNLGALAANFLLGFGGDAL